MMNNFALIVEKLKKNQVVAYPTEAVFGLGCNPNSEQGVRSLLKLKNRPEHKGLILIAHRPELLLPYLDQSQLSEQEWQRFLQVSDQQAITWIMPAHPNVPRYLRGQFESIAVRLCTLPAVAQLCEAVGFPLTSTSANLTGQSPCRTADEVIAQFGEDFPVLDQPTGGRTNPSEIRDIFSQQILRQG